MPHKSRQGEGDGSWRQSSFSKKWQENTSFAHQGLYGQVTAAAAPLRDQQRKISNSKQSETSWNCWFWQINFQHLEKQELNTMQKTQQQFSQSWSPSVLLDWGYVQERENRGNPVTALQNLEPAKPWKEQTEKEMGKRDGVVNWEDLQGLSQAN